MVKDNNITIDDKEYNIEDFNEEQKYFILQIRDLQPKVNQLRIQLDQVQIASNVFINKLKESLQEEVKEN